MNDNKNPTLFDEEKADDRLAMSYALQVLPTTLHERYPEISDYFTIFDLVRIVDVYVYKYESNPLSLPTFINKQAFRDAEVKFPGLLNEHFCIIVNTFLVLYMSYRIISHNSYEHDADMIEKTVWKILEYGADSDKNYLEAVETDILRIHDVEKY